MFSTFEVQSDNTLARILWPNAEAVNALISPLLEGLPPGTQTFIKDFATQSLEFSELMIGGFAVGIMWFGIYGDNQEVCQYNDIAITPIEDTIVLFEKLLQSAGVDPNSLAFVQAVEAIKQFIELDLKLESDSE